MGMSRDDFQLVNGFDMRFIGWGDQDVDLAVRLRENGLRCGWAGPRSSLLHLWHPSSMSVERETWLLLQETIQSKRTRAVEGIRELEDQLVAVS